MDVGVISGMVLMAVLATPAALPDDDTHAEPVNGTHNGTYSGADLCPGCGTVALMRAEGCRTCLACGYSEC